MNQILTAVGLLGFCVALAIVLGAFLTPAETFKTDDENEKPHPKNNGDDIP